MRNASPSYPYMCRWKPKSEPEEGLRMSNLRKPVAKRSGHFVSWLSVRDNLSLEVAAKPVQSGRFGWKSIG